MFAGWFWYTWGSENSPSQRVLNLVCTLGSPGKLWKQILMLASSLRDWFPLVWVRPELQELQSSPGAFWCATKFENYSLEKRRQVWWIHLEDGENKIWLQLKTGKEVEKNKRQSFPVWQFYPSSIWSVNNQIQRNKIQFCQTTIWLMWKRVLKMIFN